MFRWMGKQAKYAKIRARQARDKKEAGRAGHKEMLPEQLQLPQDVPQAVQASLDSNESIMRKIIGNHDSMIYRRFQAGKSVKKMALLVAVSGLIDKAILNECVISPMMKADIPSDCPDMMRLLEDSVLAVMDLSEQTDFSRITQLILQGNAALFLEGEQKALLIPAAHWKSRGIEQPLSETVIRGPRDSFVEDLHTNISLLRRRIHHPNLRLETTLIGTMTQTKVVIAYVEGIVNDAIVREVRSRLSKIKIDALLESGYIEQYIEDAPFSLFPTIANTEKPDIAAARILEGRVAILVDGTPIVLTVPDLLISHFQVSEDYYARPFYASMMRLLRILSFFTTIMLPGLFLSIQYYHPILIPYSLLVSLAKAREGVPFQLYIEVILMILVFEVIREAGIRMPRPIGQAISIVGALILGQAAVEAGLVGLPVVVVVAFAGISTFLVNSLVEPISILRLIFAVAGASLGIYGILLLGMIVVTHLASIRTFGIPYAAPLFPIVWKDWKDTILRLPLPMLWHRPGTLDPQDDVRQKTEGKSTNAKSEKK